jgi:hypothetical protein
VIGGSGGSNSNVDNGSPVVGRDGRFSGEVGAQFECIGVEESEGEVGFTREGKIPKRSSAPV